MIYILWRFIVSESECMLASTLGSVLRGAKHSFRMQSAYLVARLRNGISIVLYNAIIIRDPTMAKLAELHRR